MWGEGYGGSLALLAMSNFKSSIRCSVVIDPVSNWAAHLREAPAHQKSKLRAEFGDERVDETRDFLDHFSPLDTAGNNLEAIPSSSPVLLFGKPGKLANIFREKKQSGWMLKKIKSSRIAEEEDRFLEATLFLRNILIHPTSR